MITLEDKQKEAEQKASELSTQLNAKVIPFVFAVLGSEGEYVEGFLKEPSRQIKTMYLDKVGSIGLGSAASQLLEMCLLKEHSDKRVVDEDVYWFGACGLVSEIVQAANNQLKKK